MFYSKGNDRGQKWVHDKIRGIQRETRTYQCEVSEVVAFADKNQRNQRFHSDRLPFAKTAEPCHWSC